MVVTSVHEFIQHVINASHPFGAPKTLPISICNHIICNLDCCIIPSFRRLYTDHATSNDLDGAYQRRKVQEILAAAQQAEDMVHQVQEIARGIHGQSFHMFHIPPGVPNAETPAPPVIRAYPSHVKRTLAKYQAGPGTPTGNRTPYNQSQCRPLKCVGCGGPHGYQDKNGNITCPYGHDPKVKATTERKYKAFYQRLEEKYKAQMSRFQGCGGGGRGRSGGRGSGRPVDYLKMLANNQRKIREQVLAAQASSTVSGLVFMLTGPSAKLAESLHAQVLATTNAPACRVLPIKIHAAFPHIIMQLGSILVGSDCPSIRAVIDTAATLTTGNLHFFAFIAKTFPHTVAAVYAPHDYAPITLSRIVEQDGESSTPELMVAFKFKIPYHMKEGNPTTFMVAVGPNVRVNAILGLPFIKQTKMIVDAADQVAELCALDALPFPIDFCRAQCHVPTINETKVHVNMTQYADIIQEINNIEQLYLTIAGVQHTATPPSPKGGLLKKRSHPNLQVRIDPAFSPVQEHGIPSIGHNLEPFNVVMPIGDDSFDIDRYKA
jgi:hypothetical protein